MNADGILFVWRAASTSPPAPEVDYSSDTPPVLGLLLFVAFIGLMFAIGRWASRRDRGR